MASICLSHFYLDNPMEPVTGINHTFLSLPCKYNLPIWVKIQRALLVNYDADKTKQFGNAYSQQRLLLVSNLKTILAWLDFSWRGSLPTLHLAGDLAGLA